jgi:predicted RNase H-like nuclease
MGSRSPSRSLLLGAKPASLDGAQQEEGAAERIDVLSSVFPDIERHLANRPPQVGSDDLLDAAAAAWTALRRHRGEAKCVCPPERDNRGLSVTIFF